MSRLGNVIHTPKSVMFELLTYSRWVTVCVAITHVACVFEGFFQHSKSMQVRAIRNYFMSHEPGNGKAIHPRLFQMCCFVEQTVTINPFN